MSEIEMHSVVALLENLPGEGLVRGQVGTVVENWAPGVHEVEFCDDNGRAYAIGCIEGRAIDAPPPRAPPEADCVSKCKQGIATAKVGRIWGILPRVSDIIAVCRQSAGRVPPVLPTPRSPLRTGDSCRPPLASSS